MLAVMGIVGVSLVLSGGLTLSLFENLSISNAQQELDLNVIRYKELIQSTECQPRIGCVGDLTELVTVLQETNAVNRFGLGGDRLLLLQGPPFGETTVIYDSQQQSMLGSSIPIQGASLQVSGSRVYQATTTLGGARFMVAASYARPTLGALSTAPFSGWVVIARPLAGVKAQATKQLVPPILEAAGAALILAVIVSVAISRAMTRPLGELRMAAEDIAQGNYSRRVEVAGKAEVGVLGQAFNEMAEAVEKARETQRQFLADVSHELKTPLTSLIGFSQALVDDSPLTDAERHRAATILHEEAERVLRMSQELLDLARAESGQLRIDTQDVDLAAQLGQEVDLVRKRAEARHLVLNVSLAAALPPVKADPERLHQIIENLLDNAVKYAPESSIVSVGAEARGRRVEIEVRNRLGNNPPDPERMFDRFYRADPSRASGAGGVGLGLAISRQLATAQAGELRARVQDEMLVMTLALPASPLAPPGEPAPGRSASPQLQPQTDAP